MLKEQLAGRIRFETSIADWQSAVRLAAEPLVRQGCVEERYVAAMLRSVEENGSYIVILPRFAIPHARPEEGVVKTGIAFLGLETPVLFPEDKPVTRIVVLAAGDSDTHQAIIAELTELLIDDDALAALFAARTEWELIKVLEEGA